MRMQQQDLQFAVPVSSKAYSAFTSTTTIITYDVAVYLPLSSNLLQSAVGSIAEELSPRIWGNAFHATALPAIAKCTAGTFQKLTSKLDDQIALSNLAFKLPEFNARTDFQFVFKSQSPREFFLAGSHYFNIDFGFLAQPNIDLVSSGCGALAGE